jgi:hypothetical protein
MIRPKSWAWLYRANEIRSPYRRFIVLASTSASWLREDLCALAPLCFTACFLTLLLPHGIYYDDDAATQGGF